MALTATPTTGLRLLHGSLKPLVVFYVGVPLLTAILFGLNHSGNAKHMATWDSIFYWMGITFPLWFTLDGASRAAKVIFKPWSPQIWVSLLVGSIIAMAIITPYLQFYTSYAFSLFAPQIDFYPPRNLVQSWPNVEHLVKFGVVPLYWLVATWIIARVFQFPHYIADELLPASSPATGDSISQRAPVDVNAIERVGFYALIPHRLGLDILSMHAEDHYVRVSTRVGDTLIRYRFNDAVKEAYRLGGVQIHRSHWVRIAAIEKIVQDEGIKKVRLENGNLVPVSRSYLGVLKAINVVQHNELI